MSGLSRIVAVPLAISAASALATFDTLTATQQEPRAYGYFVGDVVSRRIDVQLPDGLVLDADSLPRTGRPGQAVELRQVNWQRPSVWSAGRARLMLDYQVFIAPREVRTFEMPPITLRFAGTPPMQRTQELRIDAWPLTVAPLAPPDASPRHGLGELRPDAAPPTIDTRAARRRLAVYGGVALLLLGYLAQVYLALPWLARRARPFGRACAELRPLSAGSSPEELRAAMLAVHQALNHTAGHVLFAPGVAAFVEAHPRFRPMQAELTDFFQRSRAAFFGADADAAAGVNAGWLLALCHRARDLERGAA
jgi:mxaA protein